MLPTISAKTIFHAIKAQYMDCIFCVDDDVFDIVMSHSQSRKKRFRSFHTEPARSQIASQSLWTGVWLIKYMFRSMIQKRSDVIARFVINSYSKSDC